MTEPRCTGEKTCTHCGETKPVLAFPADRKRKDGTCPWCRECKHRDNLRRYRRKRRAKMGPESPSMFWKTFGRYLKSEYLPPEGADE